MFDHCMYFNTAALARRLEREWTEAFAPFGVTPPQGFMLRAVIDRPGMVQSELATLLSIARPTATRALDGLERLGLIERSTGKADGREIVVHPTRKARSIKTGLTASSAAVTQRLKHLLGDDVFRDSVEQVKSIRSALD